MMQITIIQRAILKQKEGEGESPRPYIKGENAMLLYELLTAFAVLVLPAWALLGGAMLFERAMKKGKKDK